LEVSSIVGWLFIVVYKYIQLEHSLILLLMTSIKNENLFVNLHLKFREFYTGFFFFVIYSKINL